MKTIENEDFNQKTVLVRVDFNVPLNDQFKVTDSTRIHAAKPTIETLVKSGAKCVLLTHLGRPKGPDPDLSLKHIVPEVSKILGQRVHFSEQTIGKQAVEMITNQAFGEVILMENLRFFSEETQGEKKFARALADLGDAYVNDAFGTAHRAHASTAIIADFFPKDKYFGMLLKGEVEAIQKVMVTGKKPVLAIIGGAMVYTFIQAQGGSVGDSICEPDLKETALSLLEKATKKNVRVHLPIDVKIADAFDNEAKIKTAPVGEIPDNWMALDCGPKSLEFFGEVVHQAKTILWNGPLGVFEMERFAEGTIGLGKQIASSTSQGAYSLVGGGDSVAAVKQFGLENQMSYVSTGGGAMLESLEGKQLPGIAALLS